MSLGYSRVWLLALSVVIFLAFWLVSGQLIKTRWAITLSIVAALVAFIGIDRWAPQPQAASSGGYLQLGLIAPPSTTAFEIGKPFAMNIHSVNPTAERVYNAIGWSDVKIKDAEIGSDDEALSDLARETVPLKAAYVSGEIKGVIEGNGEGTWGTVETPPLSAQQFLGIASGTIRLYYISWYAWEDAAGRKQYATDCRWLQGAEGTPPKFYNTFHVCTSVPVKSRAFPNGR